VHMVRKLGYGGRRSHRIAGTFVRTCRERGIKANGATGDLLDEAAGFLGEKPPKIDTPTLRTLLDPVEFIASHDNIGGTAPQEAKRMLSARRHIIEDLRKQQANRHDRIRKGEALLQREVDEILGG